MVVCSLASHIFMAIFGPSNIFILPLYFCNDDKLLLLLLYYVIYGWLITFAIALLNKNKTSKESLHNFTFQLYFGQYRFQIFTEMVCIINNQYIVLMYRVGGSQYYPVKQWINQDCHLLTIFLVGQPSSG